MKIPSDLEPEIDTGNLRSPDEVSDWLERADKFLSWFEEKCSVPLNERGYFGRMSKAKESTGTERTWYSVAVASYVTHLELLTFNLKHFVRANRIWIGGGASLELKAKTIERYHELRRAGKKKAQAIREISSESGKSERTLRRWLSGGTSRILRMFTMPPFDATDPYESPAQIEKFLNDADTVARIGDSHTDDGVKVYTAVDRTNGR